MAPAHSCKFFFDHRRDVFDTKRVKAGQYERIKSFAEINQIESAVPTLLKLNRDVPIETANLISTNEVVISIQLETLISDRVQYIKKTGNAVITAGLKNIQEKYTHTHMYTNGKLCYH